MKRWFILFIGMAAFPALADYAVAPDIAREYTDLKAKVRQNPDSADINFEYAVCLSYMGKIEAGRAALQKVRRLNPGFPRNALPGYLEAYRQNPTNPKTKYRLGFLYYFNNEYEQALNILGEVAVHQPVGQLNAWALGYMALIKGEQKKWEEAEKLVRQALRIEPDAYGLHAALAVTLKEQGRLFAATGEYVIAYRERRNFEHYEKTRLPQ